MGAWVGIDLGTTFSVVAHIDREGRPAAIADANGQVLIPSVVYLGEGGPLVGIPAKELQATGASEIGAFFKRHMGDNQFQLAFCGKAYSPVDLSALVLKYLKGIAERHLDQPVDRAVITVPAYFNNLQRQATIAAGRLAELEVLAIISEPTAAALAYGQRRSEVEQNLLVYDLGGGTFDVSVVRITTEEMLELGTGGDHHLGGKDWDDRLLGYLAQRFEDEFGVELLGEDFNGLLVKAEATKRALSTRQRVEVSLRSHGHRAVYTISRDTFADLTEDLLRRTDQLAGQVLEDIGLGWPDLDGVLLVGGSTRMPMVSDWVQHLSGKPPLTAVNPDEAVALGAAIQAAEEVAQREDAPKVVLGGRRRSVDVMSHSLGMIAINEAGERYINSLIIRKNQPIPASHSRPYALRVGRSANPSLEVYLTQGETDDPQACAYLGRYVFFGITRGKAGEIVLDICYAYDKNGIVQVSACERGVETPLALSIEPLPDDVPARFLLPPEKANHRQHLSVCLAFDLSGSMAGEPVHKAKQAAMAFLEQCDLSSTSVGLVAFSDRVEWTLPPCQDARRIETAIGQLSVGQTGFGNADDPFPALAAQMGKLGGLRYAVVLADGVWSNQARAVERARHCHGLGIEVIAVGFGSADRKFLDQISSAPGQSFFTDLGGLVEVFSSIARELTEGGLTPKRNQLFR